MKTKTIDAIDEILTLEHDAGLEPKGIVNRYYGKKSEKVIVFCYQNSIVLVT